MRLEVVRRKAAEHLGDLDHGRVSKLGHEPIEQTVQRRPSRRGEVGIDGGGGDAGVTEQDLHDADVDAILDQSCRVNDLRVFAARSRRESSVGRTRGCSGAVMVWEIRSGQCVSKPMMAAEHVPPEGHDRGVTAGSGVFGRVDGVI